PGERDSVVRHRLRLCEGCRPCQTHEDQAQENRGDEAHEVLPCVARRFVLKRGATPRTTFPRCSGRCRPGGGRESVVHRGPGGRGFGRATLTDRRRLNTKRALCPCGEWISARSAGMWGKQPCR